MIWRVIEHSAKSGKFNMDFDVRLARECEEDEIFLRLYEWKPYAISLGANQSEEDLDIEKVKADSIDVVKRPTGGRAILHSEELTYSFVSPNSIGLSASDLYNAISNALIEGLKIFNPLFKKLEMEKLQPNFAEIIKQPSGIVCFNSSARHEVKFEGRKLIGSAQRKFQNTILQHGSILVGRFHRNLVRYLKLSEDVKNSLAEEMSRKTIELQTILHEEVDFSLLRKAIIKGFEKYFNVEFERVPFAETSDVIA